MKRITALLVLVLMLMPIIGLAATRTMYCNQCQADRTFNMNCTGVHAYSQGPFQCMEPLPCLRYVTNIYYTSPKCDVCGVVWVNWTTHTHKTTHANTSHNRLFCR